MKDKRHSDNSEAISFETIDARQLESLRAFHEVARALTSNLEVNALLRTIVRKMEEYFGPDHWSLLIVDEKTDELYYALSAGNASEGVRVPRSEGIAGMVASTGQPLVIADIAADPVWSLYAAQHPELHLHSIAALPISHGDRTLGVLLLHNSKIDLLPDSSLSFLRVLCDYAAIALHNANQVRTIHDLSITDDCTGLFNARFLYSSVEEQIAAANNRRVRPIQPHFSLLFFDLDHFKAINDEHGHLIGSRLLAEVGNLVKRLLSEQPEARHSGFRYGGDEFVALLRGLDKAAASALAEALRARLAAHDFLTGEGRILKITASFGLATFPQDGDSLHDIIRSADVMMYRAKAAGRNQVCVADAADPATMVSPRFPSADTANFQNIMH